MTDRPALQPVDYARMAVDVASEGQASDISKCSDFTDYFVILSVESSRQMRSIVGELEGALERAGARLHHREGSPQGGWRLLDFGDVIIHVFGAEERDYYRIEGAWPEAAKVVRIQ
jgi:ribosome-associated protein